MARPARRKAGALREQSSRRAGLAGPELAGVSRHGDAEPDAVMPLRGRRGPRQERRRARGRREVCAPRHRQRCLLPERSRPTIGAQDRPSPWPGSGTRAVCARRYAACDVYGLAAGLAASFADLAASCPNSELDKFLTCTLLRTCAPWVQRVRPGARVRQQAALHRPPQAGCAPRRRWCTGACPPSQRRGARPARPGPPSWRSTTPACRPCSSG